MKEFYTLFFVWITCLVAIFSYRKSLTLASRQYIVFIVLMSVAETAGNFMAFKNIDNHYFFNIIYAIELTLLPYFFHSWLQSSWIKNIIRVFVFVFPLFILVNSIWIQGFSTLQTYSFVVGGSTVLLLSVAYLWELYSRNDTENIIGDSVFWFSIGYILYFAVSVPYFGMLNYLIKNHLQFAKTYYYIIMDGTICLFNILLTTGFLCLKRTTK